MCSLSLLKSSLLHYHRISMDECCCLLYQKSERGEGGRERKREIVGGKEEGGEGGVDRGRE